MKKSDEERAREIRNEYYREYRKAHPLQVKEAQNRYWLRKAEKMSAAENEGVEDEKSKF